MDDGLLVGSHNCYLGEFDDVNIGQEMKDDHRALERRLGGSNNTTQAIGSTMMFYFRCLDGKFRLLSRFRSIEIQTTPLRKFWEREIKT
jgi:hypothetical protein